VELTEPHALSDLIGRPVYDGAGRRLGRVYEIRGHHEGGEIVIDELLVGPRGLLKRLRGPGVGARAIPWAQVSEVGERIVVAV
jgi:sporulation protein YlmC with PRC-barrel domain